jgi:hypothetical protein
LRLIVFQLNCSIGDEFFKAQLAGFTKANGVRLAKLSTKNHDPD